MSGPPVCGPHPKSDGDAGNPESAPVVVIHSLAQAVAALGAAAEAGRPIALVSAPDSGIYAGPTWFREVMRAAREAVPKAECSAIFDCGDDAGATMAAIRAGIEALVFTGDSSIARRLADIARQRGARLLTKRPAVMLDLRGSFFADNETLRRRCADALASRPAFC